MNVSLERQRAVVTGGSSGIGAAIAVALAAAGAKVAITYRTHGEAAQALATKIGPERALAIAADVSDAGAVGRMFGQVDQAWGGLDILVNSAGIDGARAMLWDSELTNWRRVIEVNLLGAYYCAREAVRRMVAQRRGVVLSVSSVHETIAWSGYSAYTASKAGLAMLTKTLALEAAPHGVRVLAVSPGAIRTPINRSVWSDPEQLKDLLTKIPLNRIGEPEEVARMVVVLVSEVASYVTGRTIFIDGGMSDNPSFAHGG